MIRSLSLHPQRWILLAGPLLGGLAALYFGFTPDWDMLNYHFYNPHALLRGRLSIDTAPAQLQSFYNPLLHVPQYIAFYQLNPAVVVFATGALQGSQLFLLGLILRRLIGASVVPAWMLWTIAALGLCGPVFLSELGTTMNDSVLSILVLCGVLLQLPDGDRQQPKTTIPKAAAVSGLLLGLATALKLVFALYAIALGLALLLARPGKSGLRMAWYYHCGAMLGFLLGGGAWFAYLWWHYQNPFFPYFNQVFQSSWIGESSFRDLRFMPHSLFDWLAYPLVWLWDPQRVWEWPFRDLRVVVLYPLLFLGTLFAWRRLGRTSSGLRLVLVFLALSYVLWLPVFSIYRYLVVLEMLAPLVLFAWVICLGAGRRAVYAAVVLLLCSQFFVAFHRLPAMWELRADSPSSLAVLPQNAMVIIDGYEPVAYAALWLDDKTPLVRIRANFMNQKLPVTRIHRHAEQRVRDHAGPIFLMASVENLQADFLKPDLARVGLELDRKSNCQPVFPDEKLQHGTGLLLCALRRLEVRAPVQPAR